MLILNTIYFPIFLGVGGKGRGKKKKKYIFSKRKGSSAFRKHLHTCSPVGSAGHLLHPSPLPSSVSPLVPQPNWFGFSVAHEKQTHYMNAGSAAAARALKAPPPKRSASARWGTASAGPPKHHDSNRRPPGSRSGQLPLAATGWAGPRRRPRAHGAAALFELR